MIADLLNGGVLLLALALAITGAVWQGEEVEGAGPTVVSAPPPPEGATELTDARGVVVPVADYQRIVSLNTVADHLLLELVEPARLVGVTGWTATRHPEAWRFGGRAQVASSDQLEQLIELEPDLVVVSKFADENLMARLREAGILVFDLGETRGVSTTLPNIRTLAALLQARDRGAQLEARFSLELQALDDAVDDADRPQGLFLTVYGDSISGGSAGTSYGDMLHYAGVRDLAEEHGYREWPQYTPEQIIAMDPALVITEPNMAAAICGHSVLAELRACGPEGRVVEVAGGYIGDPGLGVVQAAAAVQALVHP